MPWAQAQHRPRYTVTEISPIAGGQDNVGNAINQRSDVAGLSGYSGYSFTLGHAFLERDGDVTDLIARVGAFPRVVYSSANGINDKDDVVGDYVTQYQNLVGFLYDYSDDSLKTIPPPEDGGSLLPYAINNRGQIAADALYGDHRLACLYENGTTETLNALAHVDYASSRGLAINNEGAITGSIEVGSGTHVYLYRNRELRDLGGLFPETGAQAEGHGINNRDQIAGTAQSAHGIERAFVWSQGRFINLGTLHAGTSSSASAINDDGEIVGNSTTSSGIHAFVYVHAHMYQLDHAIPADSGWTLSTATAINNRGEITGYGTFQGHTRAYLLRPTGQDSDGDGDDD